MFSVDYFHKQITLNDPISCTELESKLIPMFYDYPNDPFPIDIWKDEDNTIFVCETETWIVNNPQNITDAIWVDWKNK